MFTYRKFYDIDAPEAPSIASIMAKSGVLNSSERGVEVPKINTAEQEKPPTPATAPAPATASQPVAPAKSETPAPSEPAKPAPAQTEQPAPAVSWQEVLKQQQPNTVLKELGYGESLADFLSSTKDLDPKMLGFLKYWQESGGKVDPYLKALVTDYSKMAPEEVMRHHLQEQHPELDSKQLDRLYKLKVLDRYKLDSTNYTEDEVEDGRVELLADVKPVREALMTKQQDYLLPKPAAKQPEVDTQAQQQQQNLEAYRGVVNNHPLTKHIVANKVLPILEGEDAFNLPIDPVRVITLLNDDKEWGNAMFVTNERPDGSKEFVPDMETQLLVSAILADRKGTLQALAKHYKALGAKSAVAPLENAKPPDNSGPAHAEKESNDPAAAMAKRGRVNRGGSN